MAPPPQLLVIEDDVVLQGSLQQVLFEQGYAAMVTSSLEEALHLVHRQPFDLILTELFTPSDQKTVAFLHWLRALAHATPVVVMASWFTAREVRQQGFSGLLSKPFRLDDLITTVAEHLNHPFTALQLRQAEVTRRFIAALIQGDVEAAIALCTEEVQLFPWIVPAYPSARPVTGRADARAYLQEMKRYFGTYQMELAQLYPCPHGLAVRLLLHWQDPAGAFQQQMVGLCFQVSGEQISQVGIPAQDERLRTLLGR